MTTRQEQNRQIVQLMQTLVESYPDLRFGQILQNFGFVDVLELHKHVMEFSGNVWTDEFYKEPEVILKRVKEAIIKLREQS